MAEKKDSGFHQKSLPEEAEDCSLYSLDRYQLKNLIDKNIRFSFFQIEDFSCHYDRLTQFFLMKTEKKTEKELLSNLKSQDSKQPMVLICDKGQLSQQLSKKLRSQGFVNVYFVKEGLRGLLEKGSQ